MDEGIVIPISEINSVRRNAIQKLINIRQAKKIRRKENILFNIEDKKCKKPLLTAKVRNREQARACISNNIERIYAPLDVINEFM